MKQTTIKSLERSEHFLSRVFMDRNRKRYNALIEEQRAINKECGGNVLPAYLYNYYVSICQVPSWDLTNDQAIAKQLGLSERKVADTRRLLTKIGWIRFDTHKHGPIKYGMWYIGYDVVAKKFGADTTLDEYLALGIVTEEEVDSIRAYGEVSDE
jgi:hypothetical protein